MARVSTKTSCFALRTRMYKHVDHWMTLAAARCKTLNDVEIIICPTRTSMGIECNSAKRTAVPRFILVLGEILPYVNNSIKAASMTWEELRGI